VLNCPVCGSDDVCRSPSRTLVERLQKRFTAERLHRCQACRWRGWGAVSHPHHVSQNRPIAPTPPDLAAIDAALAIPPREPPSFEDFDQQPLPAHPAVWPPER
jgi:hypothetical protein